jgi:hypothetical protein
MVRVWHFMVDILVTAGFVVFFPVIVLLCILLFIAKQWNAQQLSTMGLA